MYSVSSPAASSPPASAKDSSRKVLRRSLSVSPPSDPASHPLWRLAESFGAGCSGALDDATTHVIAGASGTEKVLAARGMGKWVVTPAWLECSCILWKRAHEERFLAPL